MIIVKNGDRELYNPRNPYLQIISPCLTLEDNSAGSLTFKIYDSNPNYGTIKKLFPIISVVRDGETIFKGRVIDDARDFYNGKTVEVEEKMAFFNDSCMEPFEFSGSPAELFAMIIENHNRQVKEWQQFKVGDVTVFDNNDYIVRSSENIQDSWTLLKDKCFQSSLGGHVRIRYEEDGDYIDWLADYEKLSSQSIEFAKNMADISIRVNAAETYTAIRPVGAEVDGVKIDISSVNDGRNYLVNEEKAEEYGVIFAPEAESTWNDVTLPQNLLKKAQEKLSNTFTALSESYEINAIDLHLTDAQIEALNICEYVQVTSRIHGINGRYLLNKADIYIAEPQNSVYYLGGVTRRTLSDMNGRQTSAQPSLADIPKDVSAFRNDANYVSEEKAEELLQPYAKTEEVTEIIAQCVEMLPPGKDGLSAYEVAAANGFVGDEASWLESLKGKDGDPGAPGRDGQDGLSAYEIAQTHGYKEDEASWLESLKGEDGKPGAPGEKGEPGEVPNLSEYALQQWCEEQFQKKAAMFLRKK